jgi:hypothetical protein
MVELSIHSSTRLHGLLFNEFITGITLPLHFYKLDKTMFYYIYSYLSQQLGTLDSADGKLTRPRVRSSNPSAGKICLLSTSSRPSLGSTQPTFESVPAALSQE